MNGIEMMEMERHKKLLRRAKKNGGYVHGPGGIRIPLVQHEFPYDVGIYRNIASGMGSNWVSTYNGKVTPSC